MIPGDRTTTCDHVGVQRMCPHRDHAILRGLHYHPRPWWHQAWTTVEGIWVCGPAAVGLCVDVSGSCYHQRSSTYLGAGLPLGDMFGPRWHAVTGSMPIWVACMQCQLGSWWLLDLSFCQGPYLGPWTYCSLGLCWYPWSRLSPRDTQMSKIWDATHGRVGVWGLYCCETIQTWMTCNANQGHGVIQAKSVDGGHAWGHDPATARVYVDVLSSCCHLGCFLWSYWCSKAMKLLGPCKSEWSLLAARTMTFGTGCWQGPCLGLWPNCSWNLCWYSWPMLPPRTVQMTRIWATT